MNSSMISGGGLMKSDTRLTPSPFNRFSFTASSAIFTTIGMPLMTGAPSTAWPLRAANSNIGMPPPGMSTSQPTATSGRACSAKSRTTSAASASELVGFQHLPRLERHRVHAGDALLQPVFADLVVEPGNEARIDGDDAGALAKLAGMEHRGFAERHDRNVDDRTRFVKSGVLEVTDDKGVVAFAFGFHRVADDFPGAAEFDDRMRIIVVRGDAFDIDRGAGIDKIGEMAAQAVPIDLAVFFVDVALIPDADQGFIV